MATSNDVANEALMLMGNANQTPVTGVNPTWDDSDAGVALQYLYGPCVAAAARQWAWDFVRSTVTLSLSGNTAPVPYNYEYTYPAAAVEVLQLFPGGVVLDDNNPVPQNWVVGNAVVSGSQGRVIWTNVASAKAVINNNPNENTWDSLFRASVVRLLASELAIALAGKPETSTVLLDSSSMFAAIAKTRED